VPDTVFEFTTYESRSPAHIRSIAGSCDTSSSLTFGPMLGTAVNFADGIPRKQSETAPMTHG